MIHELLNFVPAFKFCIDLVIDRTLAMTACVTGAPSSVYRVSADVASQMYRFSVPERADIVMIDSHPFDTNILPGLARAVCCAWNVERGRRDRYCFADFGSSIATIGIACKAFVGVARDADSHEQYR